MFDVYGLTDQNGALISPLDKTNAIVKLCRRMTELEYRLACKDMEYRDEELVRYELEECERVYNLIYIY